jgi:hypothetical protein
MMTSPFVAPDRDAPRLFHIVSSPIGRLLLLGDGHALTGLWMIDAERHTSRFGDGLTPSPETFREAAAQLEASSRSSPCRWRRAGPRSRWPCGPS